MKLSISNIAWPMEQDGNVYALMKEHGFTGLEIAPTRIFPEAPYDRLEEAREWSGEIAKTYGFEIPSMQSIWHGRKERMFVSKNERDVLLDYTKKAIDFAEAISCVNLVFGCPRNRSLPRDADVSPAIAFFRNMGDYAASHGIVIGMEPNPAIYGTNYINDTLSAIALIERVESDGFRLNLDIGTMVENNETVDELAGKTSLISHVHISEPGLKQIARRNLHRRLHRLLEKESYQGYVSIEMGKTGNIAEIGQTMKYVKEVFGDG